MLNNNSRMDEVTPLEFYLSQNYPNPFKERTTIKYCVAYKTRVQLTVLKSGGEVVEKLIDEEKKPGTYEVVFNCVKTGHAPSLRYRLEAGDYSSEKIMILEK